MKGFIQRHGRKIPGVLSGFDRMRFRSSFTPLASVGGLLAWLRRAASCSALQGVRPGSHRPDSRQASEAGAIAAGRPVRYLNGFVDKEALIAGERPRAQPQSTAHGLV